MHTCIINLAMIVSTLLQLIPSFIYVVYLASTTTGFSIILTTPMRRTCGTWTGPLRSDRTLASDYVINLSESSWSAYRINCVTTDKNAPKGEMAVTSLYTELSDAVDPDFTLSASVLNDIIIVMLQHGPTLSGLDETLIAILSRIMAQWVIQKQGILSQPFAVQLPNEELTVALNLHNENEVLKLFQPLIRSTETMELSEMVTQNGECLGMVPRKLVHSANLLHRGIGMVVAKDKPILQPGFSDFPDLYTHRRTDSKRIFPSLYDMFVGGVSTAREDAKTTAAREVAEELGLERALWDPTMLSDPLFNCTICTSYNRCVVTMFCCTFDSTKDVIRWQEEEVAWGNFIPYDDIVASADLSIQRLIDGKSWPGSIPLDMEARLSRSKVHKGVDLSMKDWDYVPDGLLVWEAWLRWQNEPNDS